MDEFGCLSNMNDYLTYVTGVGVLITTTKIVLCGLKARVPFDLRTKNLDPLYVLHIQPSRKTVVHVSGFFEDKGSH